MVNVIMQVLTNSCMPDANPFIFAIFSRLCKDEELAARQVGEQEP